jgi:hypothetical protein
MITRIPARCFCFAALGLALLLLVVSASSRATATGTGPPGPPQCDNKCRHRVYHKDPVGVCTIFAIDTCRYCEGKYGLCYPDSKDVFTNWSCKLHETNGQLVYTTDACDPVCPWANGYYSETSNQAYDLSTAKVRDLYTCKP